MNRNSRDDKSKRPARKYIPVKDKPANNNRPKPANQRTPKTWKKDVSGSGSDEREGRVSKNRDTGFSEESKRKTDTFSRRPVNKTRFDEKQKGYRPSAGAGNYTSHKPASRERNFTSSDSANQFPARKTTGSTQKRYHTEKDLKPEGYRPSAGPGNYAKDKPTDRKRNFTSLENHHTSHKPSNSAHKRFQSEKDLKPRSAASSVYKKPVNEERKWDREEHIPSARAKKTPFKDESRIRLNRYIANAGICARRKADELIQAGVVSVNGEAVTELGSTVDPQKDIVRYNGEILKREKNTYVLLNKPKDYITTTEDPQERRTVMQLVEKASRERIYPVGRLDRNTTGLLLMTNDGDLAEKLSHPRNSITKIYNIELNKGLSQGDLNKIAYGIELEDGLIKPDAVSYVQGGSKREVGIQIHSGKNRIVRRIFEYLGYDVVKLDRVVYGNLTKKDLPRGRWRYLEEKEIIQIKHLIR